MDAPADPAGAAGPAAGSGGGGGGTEGLLGKIRGGRRRPGRPGGPLSSMFMPMAKFEELFGEAAALPLLADLAVEVSMCA